MSSSSRDQAMHEYLDALLLETEEPEVTTAPTLDTSKIEKLLQQASAVKEQAFAQTEEQTEPQVEQSTEVESAPVEAEVAAEPEVAQVEEVEQVEEAEEVAAEQEALVEVPPPPAKDSMRDYQEGDFQALFFSVAGLKLAVPLKSLGGIHEWKEPNTIFGKPAWYLGIMTNREEKLNVVDTAQWVMPEKYNQEMADALSYRYLIMLNESRWGLACESLVTTESLSPDDVQWRKSSNGKRPWLAGVVRDKMCAILDVDAMVDMLEQGLNSQD